MKVKLLIVCTGVVTNTKPCCSTYLSYTNNLIFDWKKGVSHENKFSDKCTWLMGQKVGFFSFINSAVEDHFRLCHWCGLKSTNNIWSVLV